MKRFIFYLFITNVLITSFPIILNAQTDNIYINQGKRLFNAGNYKQAIIELSKGINQGADKHTLAEMELYLGISYKYELNNQLAVAAFKQMFIYDPDLQFKRQEIPRDMQQEIQQIKSSMKGELDITCDPACDIKGYGKQPIASSVTKEAFYSGIGTIVLEFIPLDNRYFKTSKTITVEYNKTIPITIHLDYRKGTLIVSGSPEGADVYLDGYKIGSLPFNKQVIIGEHKIKVTEDNYNSYEEQINIKENETTKREVKLIPANATLDVNVMPNGSDIYIDNIKEGITPNNISLSPLKTYHIKICKSGYADYEGNLYLNPGEDFQINRELERVYSNTIEADLLIPDTGIFPFGYGLEYEIKPWATSAFQMNPVIGLYIGLGGWYAQGSEFTSGDSSLMIGYIPIEIRIPNSFVISLYGTFEPYYYSGSTPRQSVSGIDEMAEAGLRLAISNFSMKAGYLFQNEIGGVVASLGVRL